MANYKRRKPRRQVKCVLCTPGRTGNKLEPKARMIKKDMLTEIRKAKVEN